ncbi:MAG: DNA translocase FtsK 4TM domain-containing protein, partial [Acetobacteraceae bacterium]|nr:DNA translocase FtsK 4TM domain-containing protein [Acetobacteraceae bacterium]
MSLRAVHRPVSSTGAPLTGVRRFASPAVMAVLRRRLAELIGLAAALIGLALFVALASHDPADPSLSTATTRTPANLAGPAGAYLSDLLLQGFGWAAYLPGLALLAWAWRLATHRGIGLLPLRIALLLAALPVLAAVFAMAPLPAELPARTGPAGAGGAVVADAALGTAEAVLGPFGNLVGQVLLVALALGLSAGALALSPAEWLGLGRAARHTAGSA